MARERNKKAGDAIDSEASKQSRPETKTPKTPKPLKPDPKIVKKSPNPSGGRNSEKANNVYKSKEENKKVSDNAKVKDQRDAGNKEKIDGLIFMCNSKTKSDCFRHMVMGLPQSKKDTVVSIKPGLKLFLYDFDAKLLYGIYKATSAGGMRLEPAAFSGSYPAQVRFEVHMDCLPLSEGTFRKAIMGNSGGDKIKFNTELTAQEVRKLTSLFQASPVLKSNVNTTAHGPQPHRIPLIPLRPIIPAIEAPPQPPHAEILAGGQKETAPIQREDVPLDPLSFTEKEYRMYGLRRPTLPASLPMTNLLFIASDSSQGNRDPYNPYASLARAAYPSKTDAENDQSQRRIAESEYKRPTAEQFATQPSYYHSYAYDVPRSETVDYGVREAGVSTLHSTHAANVLSDYNRSHQQPRDTGDYVFLPVSSRYSFGGPSSFPYQ